MAFLFFLHRKDRFLTLHRKWNLDNKKLAKCYISELALKEYFSIRKISLQKQPEISTAPDVFKAIQGYPY
jgi:hypothetical protein